MTKGKPYPVEFKAEVVLEFLQGIEMVNEVAARNGLNPNLARNWKAKAENDYLRRGLLRRFGIDVDESVSSRPGKRRRRRQYAAGAVSDPQIVVLPQAQGRAPDSGLR